jgi:hypothetical protein
VTARRCRPTTVFDEEEETMRHVLRIATLAALLGAGTFAAPNSASAQGFNIQIGPDRPRVERRIYREREPRIIERRIVREPRRTVCTERWRNGRRVEVCRTQ